MFLTATISSVGYDDLANEPFTIQDHCPPGCRFSLGTWTTEILSNFTKSIDFQNRIGLVLCCARLEFTIVNPCENSKMNTVIYATNGVLFQIQVAAHCWQIFLNSDRVIQNVTELGKIWRTWQIEFEWNSIVLPSIIEVAVYFTIYRAPRFSISTE